MRNLPLAAITALAAGILTAGTLWAGPDRVALPENYQAAFVNYLDVDRPDRKRVRRMYVSPEAHGTAKAGSDLPDGTILIMEDHDARTDADGNIERDADGRMIALDPVVNIFVMEKNNAWKTDNGNWDYAWYLPEGSAKPDAKFEGCFSCHTNRTERDYNFTYWKAVSDQAR